MPQASEELRRMWPGSDDQALAYLHGRGFRYDWKVHVWRKPWPAFIVNDLDWSALAYMCGEWDYGGLES